MDFPPRACARGVRAGANRWFASRLLSPITAHQLRTVVLSAAKDLLLPCVLSGKQVLRLRLRTTGCCACARGVRAGANAFSSPLCGGGCPQGRRGEALHHRAVAPSVAPTKSVAAESRSYRWRVPVAAKAAPTGGWCSVAAVSPLTRLRHPLPASGEREQSRRSRYPAG